VATRSCLAACVFHSLPTAELSAGFAEGRMYERGLISWTRGQSCKDLNRNRAGGGATPNAVQTCGGAERESDDGKSCSSANRGAKHGAPGPGSRLRQALPPRKKESSPKKQSSRPRRPVQPRFRGRLGRLRQILGKNRLLGGWGGPPPLPSGVVL
jgi:hypothetical protein